MATVILADTMIDGTGNDPVQNAAILIEKGIITQVGQHDKVSFNQRSDHVIDMGDAVILPGLIDSHCHILYIVHWEGPSGRPTSEWEPEDIIARVKSGLEGARLWLSKGVTTVRDVGSEMDFDLGLRNLITKGKTVGPRIFGSGRIIAMNGRATLSGHEISSPNEARRAAREQLRAGADLIKLFASAGVGGAFGNIIAETGWDQLTVEEMQAAAFEAHKAGRTVAIHALSAQSIKNAVQAGADSIEHGAYADEECIEMMKEANVVLVPTLAIGETLMKRGTEFGFGPHMQVNAKVAMQKGEECVRMAHAAGLRIAAGTDPVRQDTMARECEFLQRAGLSPMDVIVAATRTGAELLNIQARVGTLEKGKIADFIVLDENPMDDLGKLNSVRQVFKDGVLIVSNENV